MSSLDTDERRRTPRHRLGKLATIKLGIGIAPRYCLVSNISAEGVRIHVNGYEVLDEFVLIFPDSAAGQSGTYKVVWRSGQDIGAKFVSAVTQNV
jgi:PilZ domain